MTHHQPAFQMTEIISGPGTRMTVSRLSHMERYSSVVASKQDKEEIRTSILGIYKDRIKDLRK